MTFRDWWNNNPDLDWARDQNMLRAMTFKNLAFEAWHAALANQDSRFKPPLAACVRAMEIWGNEGDGIPEEGPIAEAYDAAKAALKEPK